MTPEERDEFERLLRDIRPEDLNTLPPAERAEAMRLLAHRPLWEPQPDNRPQIAAYQCKADMIGYGGAGGGGKSDLILGSALTKHKRTLILRREAKDLQGLIDRCREIVGKQGQFNANLNIWRGLPGDRTIQFGGLKDPGDEQHYRGNPHDGIFIDEADQVPEFQVRFVIGWLRTTDPNLHCQVILCFNPPHDEAGEYLFRMFAAWLDDEHTDPAMPGELRYFTMIDGKEVERKTQDKIKVGKEWVTPKSRTFFPARVQDNKALWDQGYADTLASMPSPIKEQLLYGDFKIGRSDGAWQAIPTSFIKAAQKRWTPTKPFSCRTLSCLGADIARGGAAATCTSQRFGTWFAPLEVTRGSLTDTGRKAATLVLARHDGNCPINVDVNGPGAACYEHLQDRLGAKAGLVRAINSGEPSDMRDSSGKFRLVNVRAAMMWAFREALDPERWKDADMPMIALPPDEELLIDLAAPRYRLTAGGILIEMKEDVEKRLGRSVDKGDAVVMAWWEAGGSGAIGIGGDKNKEWGLDQLLPERSSAFAGDEEGISMGGSSEPDREDREWWEKLGPSGEW